MWAADWLWGSEWREKDTEVDVIADDDAVSRCNTLISLFRFLTSSQWCTALQHCGDVMSHGCSRRLQESRGALPVLLLLSRHVAAFGLVPFAPLALGAASLSSASLCLINWCRCLITALYFCSGCLPGSAAKSGLLSASLSVKPLDAHIQKHRLPAIERRR